MTSQTLSPASASWGDREPEFEAEPEALHLVIAWSREEPHRIGEAAAIVDTRILGRGDRLPDDPAPRAVFYRQRPNGSLRQRPLEGPRISRVQLELTPRADGLLAVRSLGRCPLAIGGVETQTGVLGPGESMILQNSLVLLVVRRHPALISPLIARRVEPFSFGGADECGIVGESAAAWVLRDALAFAAQSGGHVLLSGPGGVGKDLAARAVHRLSPRRDRAFVGHNAAAFPEGLVDAELFGTASGFPAAGMPERPGICAEADGGTLFIDEVGELPFHLQTLLLQVLDRGGEYRRLGETRPRRSELCLVAATDRSLAELRQDFAARFSLHVPIPGLGERREDIPLIFSHLLTRVATTNAAISDRFFERRAGALAEPRISPQLVEALLRHEYTHHVRELERLMWVALSTSREQFLALTPQLVAEMQGGGSMRRSSSKLPGGARPITAPAVPRDDPPTLDIRVSVRPDGQFSVELNLGEREFPPGVVGPELLAVSAHEAGDVGARLFAALVADGRIRSAWDQAAALQPRRRIRLRLDDAAPALHSLPWEALHDPSPSAAVRTLAADLDTPFSRRVLGPWEPLGPVVERPIKVLTAIAAPSNLADYSLAPIDREREDEILSAAMRLAPPGCVAHTALRGPCTLAALAAELERGHHVLHLVAHGALRSDREAVAVFLEHPNGEVDRVEAGRFAAMVERLERSLRLVVLMSCNTASRSTSDVRFGFAPALLAAGVPAVLGMQDRIPMPTAAAFTRSFYSELWSSGEIDRAANRARAAVLTERLPGGAIPVLYGARSGLRLMSPAGGGPASPIKSGS